MDSDSSCMQPQLLLRCYKGNNMEQVGQIAFLDEAIKGYDLKRNELSYQLYDKRQLPSLVVLFFLRVIQLSSLLLLFCCEVVRVLVVHILCVWEKMRTNNSYKTFLLHFFHIACSFVFPFSLYDFLFNFRWLSEGSDVIDIWTVSSGMTSNIQMPSLY